MSRWARARDANEAPIVRDLLRAGASVQLTYGSNGEPDLLVGYAGTNHLHEVKNPEVKPSRGGASRGGALTLADVATGGAFEGMDRRLRKGQAQWHRDWKGAPPVVVEYAHESLAAIGAPLHFCTCSDCVADAALPGGA